MGVPIARIGDTSSHGGTIVSTPQGYVTDEGVLVAVTGAIHSCPITGHGETPVLGTGLPTITGQNIVKTNDEAACGALIFGTSPETTSV